MPLKEYKYNNNIVYKVGDLVYRSLDCDSVAHWTFPVTFRHGTIGKIKTIYSPTEGPYATYSVDVEIICGYFKGTIDSWSLEYVSKERPPLHEDNPIKDDPTWTIEYYTVSAIPFPSYKKRNMFDWIE
jgi:hypothetical protein